ATAGSPEATRRDGEVVVGYLGNFGAGQDLRTVVEAAARLREWAPDVRFVLVGDGKEKPRVERRAAELDVPNLSIHPPIEKARTRAFYNDCDFCLVPLAPVPIFSETVPSKLFEILACERPVVASVTGEAARVVEASGAGLVTPPGDADALARGILRLRDAVDREAMGRRGRRFVAEHYSRSALAERYLGLLERVAAGSAAAVEGCARHGGA
ncbi:MAG: glycosyltransferase family 4 protein, partial [Longimicrobiales bacterium]